MKTFKKGDWVQLEEGLEIGTRYGMVTFRSNMIFRGSKQITDILEKDHVAFVDGYFYSFEMLFLRDK